MIRHELAAAALRTSRSILGAVAEHPIAAGTNRKSGEKRIIINVGGVRFETYKSTLRNSPDTRLGWMATVDTHENLSDYDSENDEFFFDRHPGVFNMILNYYRTGRLHIPMDVCGPLFEEELNFWGIKETNIEPCCWTSYCTHRDAQQTLKALNDDDADAEEMDRHSDAEVVAAMARKFGLEDEPVNSPTNFDRLRKTVWPILSDSHSSPAAKTTSIVSIVFILAAIALMCVETMPEMRTFSNSSIHLRDDPMGHPVQYYLRHSRPPLSVEILDCFVTFFFLIDITMRFTFTPCRRKFFQGVLNWVDIIAVTTSLAALVLSQLAPSDNYSMWVQILKMPRIFRIFKLTQHFSGLKIFVHTMKASSRELLLLFVVFAIFVVVFGTFAYICEQIAGRADNQFRNIPVGFWWALVTMTTLGYGDVVPKSFPGYMVGIFCAISGVLMIAMPVPIIVNNFALFYTHAQAQRKLAKTTLKQKGDPHSNKCLGALRPFVRIPDVTSNIIENHAATAKDQANLNNNIHDFPTSMIPKTEFENGPLDQPSSMTGNGSMIIPECEDEEEAMHPTKKPFQKPEFRHSRSVDAVVMTKRVASCFKSQIAKRRTDSYSESAIDECSEGTQDLNESWPSRSANRRAAIVTVTECDAGLELTEA